MDDTSKNLRELQEGYIERLKTSIMVFENNFLKRHAQSTSKEDLLGAVYMMHGLAGTGALFGFPEISDIARKAELSLAETVKPMDIEDRLSDAQFAAFLKDISHLRDVCVKAVNGGIKQNISMSSTPSTASKAKSGPFHILVVDDDLDMAGLLMAALKNAGHTADYAPNHDEVVEKIREHRPDLIVLDILMPGQNGHVVLRTLKNNPAFSDIPVIMMSAKIEDKHVRGALEYGAVDYIFKPVDPVKVVPRIVRILEANDRLILIVDDDDFLLRLLETKLRHFGYQVMTTNRSPDALDIIERKKPDIVLIDVLMPIMNGLVCVSKIRQKYIANELPVIMMSTSDDPAIKSDSLLAGVQEYHTKPFNVDEIIAAIRRVMNQYS